MISTPSGQRIAGVKRESIPKTFQDENARIDRTRERIRRHVVPGYSAPRGGDQRATRDEIQRETNTRAGDQRPAERIWHDESVHRYYEHTARQARGRARERVIHGGRPAVSSTRVFRVRRKATAG